MLGIVVYTEIKITLTGDIVLPEFHTRDASSVKVSVQEILLL